MSGNNAGNNRMNGLRTYSKIVGCGGTYKKHYRDLESGNVTGQLPPRYWSLVTNTSTEGRGFKGSKWVKLPMNVKKVPNTLACERALGGLNAGFAAVIGNRLDTEGE